ncbi:type II toxin-antitoxin system HicA family toxin [candidate division TA06 bacterium]|uniref:Type II toxin-antitoxin system HicA family toxin n=1 Tax=candidate division TA06 bacterium TaxID=2250710 RepID=A0A933IC32_UNCT6|nr:type II toxin-antitoxin system HicA family toxin [candidate division TA06 bacterium]
MPGNIKRRELIRGLGLFGFTGPYPGGKHQFMIKGELKLRVPNPHGSGDIGIDLLRQILRQAGISLVEWESKLK